MIDLAKKMRIRARKNYKRAIRKAYRKYKIELIGKILSAKQKECYIWIPSDYRLVTRILAHKAKEYGFTYRIDFSVCDDMLIIRW